MVNPDNIACLVTGPGVLTRPLHFGKQPSMLLQDLYRLFFLYNEIDEKCSVLVLAMLILKLACIFEE